MDTNLASVFIHSLIIAAEMMWAGLWADPKVGWTVVLLVAAGFILPQTGRRTRRRSR